MKTRISLVLGGARSGKTRHAEKLIEASGLKPVYLATGSARDDEMRDRIARHQSDRAASKLDWQTIEEPLHLGKQLSTLAQPGSAVMVDCLTLWLSNCLGEATWSDQRKALMLMLEALINNSEPQKSQPNCEIILVSNETGLGVVPMGELSRQFVDESGFLHQELAQLSQRVTFVVAGLPTELKSELL